MSRIAGHAPVVVWFVNQYAGSPVHGMETRHFELGRELQALGWTVVVISGSYSHLYARQPVARGTYTIGNVDGLRYCWIRIPPYGQAASAGRVVNMVVFMLRLFLLPVRRLPRPDVIVVSSPSPFPILPAEYLARRLHARLVYEVRDLWPLSLQEIGRIPGWHPLVLVMRWLEARACRSASAIVSVLPNVGPYLESRGVPPSRVRVIPNGVGRDALETPVAAVSPAVLDAVEGASFTVGFLGTLGEANAVDVLIDAARLVADQAIRFVIVGHGSADGRLHSLAANLPNVFFVGSVACRDVQATLRAFDVCYVGYHRRTLYRFGISPNKVFDYMAAGVPVILAADAANDIVREAGCGRTVPPDDPVALAEAIRSLELAGPDERRRLGANGRAFVEREHSYAALAARYAAVLGEGAP